VKLILQTGLGAGQKPSGGSAVFEIIPKPEQVILDKQERIKYKRKMKPRLTAKVQ
jgi:hypothetical protein